MERWYGGSACARVQQTARRALRRPCQRRAASAAAAMFEYGEEAPHTTACRCLLRAAWQWHVQQRGIYRAENLPLPSICNAIQLQKIMF